MRIVIAFALALTFIPTDATAGRIEVDQFRGSRKVARSVQKDVIRLLRRDHELVKRDADGVVKAKVRRRGKRWRVRLYLIDRNGDTVKKIGFKVGRRGMSKKQMRLLRKKLRRAIADLPRSEPEDDDLFAEDDEDPLADDDDEFADDEFDEDEGDEAKAPGAPTARPDIEVNAGLAVIRRTFTFGADQGNYDGAPAGGAYLEGQVYPLAFDEKAAGWKARVGVGLVFDHSIGLKSSFPGDAMTELPTTQSRFVLDARYRYPFGEGERATTVTGSLGYEKLNFTIDRAAVPDGVTLMVPDTAYTSVVPGGSLWYPINDKAALTAAAHIKLVMSAGDITTGAQYGTGSAFGYDLDGGLEYQVSEKVVVQGGFYLAKVSLSLDGNGDLSAMGDFTSASDTYLGGYATAGFKL